MVKLRTRILKKILNVSPEMAFNSRSSLLTSKVVVDDLAKEMKDVLNSIQEKGFTESGRAVKYHLVKDLPDYIRYRQLTGQLANFNYRQLGSREEKLAFWINLYNALVIDAVIRENIQESVIESRLGVLAFFQKAAYWIHDQRFSLEDIEHGVLRANRGFPYLPGNHFSKTDPRMETMIQPIDSRIHFALNFASISCPPIAFYSPEQIDLQLDLASRSFIQQDLRIEKKIKTITISRIYSWYKRDFGGKEGILDFLISHLADPGSQKWIRENRNSLRILHHNYDWRLNKTRS